MSALVQRILVVDDEAIVVKGLQVTLQTLGYEMVGSAASAQEAFDQAERLKPELVLMDVRLKGQADGIDAAREIYERLGIPVVFLTAFADAETLRRAKVTEPFGYIMKPFEKRSLQSTIETALHKHAMVKKLLASERRFSSTLRCIGDAVIATDTHGVINFMNPVAEQLTGWSETDASGKYIDDVYRVFNEKADISMETSLYSKASRSNKSLGIVLRQREGKSLPIEDTITPIKDDQEMVTGVVIVFHDISERKQADEERERLVLELRRATANERTLQELLPICSHCKKIRDDKGYWNQIESFLKTHTLAEISHGVCPECRDKHYDPRPGLKGSPS